MPRNKLSTDGFRRLITDQLGRVCADHGWSYDNNAHRGWAFQFWVAELFCRREGLDAVLEECVFLNNDCGIDVMLEDQDQKRYHFIQAKSMRYSAQVEEADASHLCDRHGPFLDRSWVRKHVTQEAQFDIIGSYGDLLKTGYSIHYYLVATGSASERIKDMTASQQAEINREEPAVSFEVMDFTALKEFYTEAETLEQSIPERVEFQLPQDRFTIKDRPHKTLLAIVKGNSLVNLYKKERERLFAYNIRSYLGKKGLNKDIIATAEDDPGSFYYFNNGVSAICTAFEVDGNTLVAENFQIINGAQTLGALSAAKLDSDIEVLLRVTEGLSIKTDRGFNADIIKFNNTQNVVKASDFRSNDRIQTWLENKFKSLRDRGAVPKITYLRKRSNRKTAGSYIVRLEDIAKIRHSFNYEPTRSVADPKSLWTVQADGGFYEEAFGIDGEAVDFWPDADFWRTLFAITLYKIIEEKITASVKVDRSFLFLRRLRFFALALASVYFELRYPNKGSEELLRGDAEFRRMFEEFWAVAIRELNDVHYQAIEGDKITGFALVRSEQRWRALKEKFIRYLKLMSVAAV